MSEPTVRFHTVPLTASEGVLGVATLDRPKALNALDHTMIRELMKILDQLDADETIRGLWIESSAEKAFCAGGDVRDVTNSGQRGGLTDLTNSADYLADEYLLDVRLQRSQKPVIAWGDGYIMGGGMGVFQGADVRVVTEYSSLAMPEVRIGFVPDCGGSWFLNRVTHGLGICLSMSGATVGAVDACWLNLADWLLPREEKAMLFDAVCGLDFSSKANALTALGAILAKATAESSRTGPWETHGMHLAHGIRHQTPARVFAIMQAWHQRIPELFIGLEQASPGAAMVAGHQFIRARFDSLYEAVVKEHDLGMRLLADGEWCEGVRALLIDKDKNPDWRFKTIESVQPDWIDAMLAPMDWPEGHPLRLRLAAHQLFH